VYQAAGLARSGCRPSCTQALRATTLWKKMMKMMTTMMMIKKQRLGDIACRMIRVSFEMETLTLQMIHINMSS
jgi:hypothetical protein